MPGAVARTSTFALTNATLPYVMELANKGLERAVEENRALYAGVNTYHGKLTCKPVAEAFNMEYTSLEDALKGQ
jgi:alanine dehydrogenase